MAYCTFRERVPAPKDEATVQNNDFERRTPASVATTLSSSPGPDGSVHSNGNEQNGLNKANYSARRCSSIKSASISASKCIGVEAKRDVEAILLLFFFVAQTRTQLFKKV